MAHGPASDALGERGRRDPGKVQTRAWPAAPEPHDYNGGRRVGSRLRFRTTRYLSPSPTQRLHGVINVTARYQCRRRFSPRATKGENSTIAERRLEGAATALWPRSAANGARPLEMEALAVRRIMRTAVVARAAWSSRPGRRERDYQQRRERRHHGDAAPPTGEQDNDPSQRAAAYSSRATAHVAIPRRRSRRGFFSRLRTALDRRSRRVKVGTGPRYGGRRRSRRKRDVSLPSSSPGWALGDDAAPRRTAVLAERRAETRAVHDRRPARSAADCWHCRRRDRRAVGAHGMTDSRPSQTPTGCDGAAVCARRGAADARWGGGDERRKMALPRVLRDLDSQRRPSPRAEGISHTRVHDALGEIVDEDAASRDMALARTSQVATVARHIVALPIRRLRAGGAWTHGRGGVARWSRALEVAARFAAAAWRAGFAR